MLKCRTCGEMFDPSKKNIKAGYINQCGNCSRKSGDAKIKYLGRPGATPKGANIEIFRTNLETVRRVLKREGASGFTANLPLSSQASIQKWEGRKEEDER